MSEYDKLPDDFEKRSDAEKIEAIKGMFGSKSSSVIERAWGLLGDELGAAQANPDLFTRSVKADDDILDHGAFEPLREQFKKDVEQTALANLSTNRAMVLEEMNKTGVTDEQKGETAGAEQDFAVQDVQKLVPEIERIKGAKAKMLGQIVGFEHGSIDHEGNVKQTQKQFDPADRPDESIPGMPTWDVVNEQWQRTLAVEAALIRMSPSTAVFLGAGGTEDLAKLKETTDIKEARALVANALQDLAGKIDKAVPFVGDDLTFTDFPPIQQQLLIGTMSPSGTNWSKPVEKAVAGEEIADASIAHLLSTLGVATVGAAFFILANIATGGLATFLFAAGAAVSVGQAAASWDKYRDLATAQQATVDPELALVTGEQVDSALVSAILDSVFAVVDVWQGVKGAKAAIAAAKESKGLLEAGKAGAAATSRAALKSLGKAGINDADVIAKAIVELGPEEVRKLTSMSYDDLAKKVGETSELGQRLAVLGEKGISESTKELLAKLPNLATLTADEGEKVLKAALDTHGIAGTLDRVGGWAAIKKSLAMKSNSGSAAVLEGWRAGLVKELEEYIAKESDDLTKAVRTGTKEAGSDLDVQIVSGTASALQQKAESWLAGRVGKDIEGAKKLLDAEIFVDPFRSHFFDVVKDLDDAVRKEIADRMSDYERRMIEGARIKNAGGIELPAGRKIAEESPIRNPFLEFEPLSPAEQKKVAGMIDGWMTELKEAKSAEQKASLVERISKSQAQINASHADAYVGGGVRVWVTGREGKEAAEDIEKLAKAVNMDPAELLKASAAQRVSAALAEAKWLEAAAKKLAVPSVTTPEEIGALAKAVTDVGKHGARGAGQLSRAGAPNAKVLDELFGEMTKLHKADTKTIAAAIEAGELRNIEAGIVGQLERIKSATRTAVDGLGTELKTFSETADQMEEWQAVLLWQTRYAAIVDDAIIKTSAAMKILHRALEEKAQATLPEQEPNASVSPEPEPAAATP